MIELIEVIIDHLEYYLTNYIHKWIACLAVYFLIIALTK